MGEGSRLKDSVIPLMILHGSTESSRGDTPIIVTGRAGGCHSRIERRSARGGGGVRRGDASYLLTRMSLMIDSSCTSA